MEIKPYLVGIDLQGNELRNAVIHPLTTAPTPATEGQIYYNSNDNLIYVYNGSDWTSTGVTQLTVAADSQAFVSIVDNELHFQNLAITEVHVDTTQTSMANFIAAHYTAGTEFQEGDMIILTAATDQSQRSWIHNGGTAHTIADFTRLQTDLNATEVKALFSAGTGLDYSNGVFSVENSGIGTTQLADDSVTKEKIAADVAGNGLIQNANGSLEVKVDNSSIKIINDTLTIDGNVVGTALAGAGIIKNGNTLDVNVDNSTLEIVNDIVQVKDDGITQAKLAPALESKIVNAYKELVGNGTATTFTVTHNLNSTDIFCHTWKVSSGQHVECQVVIVDDNTVTVGAFPAPSTNDLKVLIQKAILS